MKQSSRAISLAEDVTHEYGKKAELMKKLFSFFATIALIGGAIAILSAGPNTGTASTTSGRSNRAAIEITEAPTQTTRKSTGISTSGIARKVPTTKPTDTPRATAVPAATQVPESHDYVCNESTKVIHRPNCASVRRMSESNKWCTHSTLSNLINQGYIPCERCNPQ